MGKQKIMLINWAPIWEGARVGGGVNLYCQQISLELVRRGYQVIYIFSGFTYNLAPFTYIRTHKPWQGIDCFEIINSPCLAPGRDNSGYPQTELKNPKIKKLFQRILNVVNPAIVHFNNIEGFSSDCIHIARQHGARVLFSLHNYHTVCPQVALLFQDKEICYDYQDGRRCYHCFPHESYWLQRVKRGINSVLAATGNPQKYKSFIKGIYNGHRVIMHSCAEYFHLVSQRIQQRTLEGPRQGKVSYSSDKSKTPPDQEAFKWVDCSESQEIGPLPKENPEIYSPYKLRRHGMIKALNEAHLVLAVSHFVAQKFIELGINPDLVQVNHIGSSIGKLVDDHYRIHPTKLYRDSTLPLKFIFIGNAGSYKGLPLLLEALERLPPRRRATCKLFIYAQHVERVLERIEALRPTLAELHVHNGYDFNRLPELLEDKDVGIVPPIWWDPAPQVVMELLANNTPVIGAHIGGIPDFIQHGVNGLLFQPGNAEDLAAKMCYVLDNVGIIKQWRKHIQPIKTIEQHVDELAIFYGV